MDSGVGEFIGGSDPTTTNLLRTLAFIFNFLPNFFRTNNDVITGNQGVDFVIDWYGNNTISTSSGSERIYTGSGNDSIDAGDDDDSVYSGSGNDFVNAGSGNDLSKGGEGDDRITAGWNSYEKTNTFDGQGGNDSLTGGAGNALLNGGSSNDCLEGLSGKDNDLVLMVAINSTLGLEAITSLKIKAIGREINFYLELKMARTHKLRTLELEQYTMKKTIHTVFPLRLEWMGVE